MYSVLGIAIIALIVMSGKIFEENDIGYFQIKQSWPAGEMTIRSNPGVYGQFFGTLHTYKKARTIYQSSDPLDGGSGDEVAGIEVQFPDGSATVNVVAQYRLPIEKNMRLLLHEVYTSPEAVNDMVRNQIQEAVKNTGSLFNSGDAYADRKAEFIQIAKAQLLDGLYLPEVKVIELTNADGSIRTEKRFSVAVDAEGKPITKKESTLTRYGIEIIQWNIKDFAFDDKLMALITERRQAQLSIQAAITARAKGDENIATERAAQEVLKIRDVTIAEKQKRVAILTAEKKYEMEKLAAMTAAETAKKIEYEGRAKALANRLLVAAGLTPEKRATIDRDTRIGVAAELAKIKLPGIMVLGGGGNGAAIDPWQAIGLESMLRVAERFSKSPTQSGTK